MILIAYALATAIAIAVIAVSHENRRMNAVTVAQGLVFGAITLAALLASPIPITSFIVGSQFFFIDHLGIYEVLIAIAIFTLSAVYAGGYVESLIATGELEKGSLRLFYGAWSLLLLIVVLAFCSDNLALFWIFAEMTTIISAMLIAVLSAKETIDAAIKYIFVASTAMLFSFAGFIFLFEASREALGPSNGTLNWTVLILHATALPEGMMVASFALVFIGFAAKSGIFPFNTWLPEAHAKAPSAVSAVLSGVLLNVGIYAIIRMTALVNQTPAMTIVKSLLMLFGILTIAIAAFSMLPQKNLKKLIAFSSIENMGILLVGLAIATPVALFWVIFHIMAHAFTKAGLFLSAGILHRQYHSKFSGDAPDEIRDVFRLQPLAAWGTIIGGLAIIGMPVFPIFFSKLFILLQLGAFSPWLLLAVLLLLFMAAAALGYFVITSFTQVSSPEAPLDIEQYVTPLGMKIPVIALIVLILALGIFFPTGEIAFINQIVTELRF
jgi:hydrogenase-4 component F